MTKKLTGVLIAALIFAVATGLVFADSSGSRNAAEGNSPESEVAFAAGLTFYSQKDEQAILRLTNLGQTEMRVAQQAHYIDNIGSAGSIAGNAGTQTVLEPGETKRIEFHLAAPCSHGENSILSFFFEYDGYWYLGKVGQKNGIEYFLDHD